MGCDIHVMAERRGSGGGYEPIADNIFSDPFSDRNVSAPFDWRAYGMFAFLAGVRNYSGVDPISSPR